MPRKAAFDRRFDMQVLRDTAGDKVFARGQAYHVDGQVEILDIDDIGHLRAGLGEQDAHAAWVDDLVLRHKAKRTFLELLRKRRPI